MSRELVERAMHGDRDASGILAQRSLPRLVGTAGLILRDADAADDAAQETLVRAWRDLPRLRDPDRFDAWLHRILVHRCGDQIRGRRGGRREGLPKRASASVSDSDAYSVAWTSGGFRAVGARGADAGSGSVLWHGDGVRWDIDLGDFGRGTLDGSYTIVREMGNGYLMAGTDGSGDATVRVSYTVEGDIGVGAIADAGAFGGGVVRDAAGSPGAWLAIGTDATGAPIVWTSADGKSWLPIVDPPFGPFAQLERVLQRPDGSFVIVGEDGVGAGSLVSLWASATGEEWYPIGTGSASVHWSQVTDATVTPDGRLVVVAVRDDPDHHGAPVAMIAIP